MKFMKRTGIYQASNVSFDPKTIEAKSYNWWKFVRVIKGEVIFNQYRYSVSTAKHQGKVRRLLEELGIEVDRTVSVRPSLDEFDTLKDLNREVRQQQRDEAEAEELKRIARNRRARDRRAEERARRALVTIGGLGQLRGEA